MRTPAHTSLRAMLLIALAALHCCTAAGLLFAQEAPGPSNVVTATPEKARRLADTVNVVFELNKVDIKPYLFGNQAQIDRFVNNARMFFQDVPKDSLLLTIYGGASPEGPPDWNDWLGEHRALALKEVLEQRLSDMVGHYEIVNEQARWQAFYDVIEASDEPWKEQVLAVVREPGLPVTSHQRDPREWKLRRMLGGTVWKRLLEIYLPPLRSSGSAVISIIQPPPPPEEPAQPAPPEEPEKPQLSYDYVTVTIGPQPCWAVKTNSLLWAVVAPNIEIEYPIGAFNRWSIEAEYFHPWWIWADNARAEQCMNIGLELRYWPGKLRPFKPWLHGWHVGLAFAAGYYDLEWKLHEGYQGEYVNPYLNVGYQWRFAKHWALEASFGVGATLTKYRHYYGETQYGASRDNHLIWNNNGRWRWAGPNHVALSLVYTINRPRYRWQYEQRLQVSETDPQPMTRAEQSTEQTTQ